MASKWVEELLGRPNDIKLVSFHGALSPPPDVDPKENYWSLIGWTGIILRPPKENSIHNNRELIKFEKPVSSLGLYCHTEVPNSLWVERTGSVMENEI
jgi:hypothetical protein